LSTQRQHLKSISRGYNTITTLKYNSKRCPNDPADELELALI
jgi:hypothetical protein